MIRLWSCAVALLLLAASADARTLAVKSGEHDGFTRLVLEPGPDADWSLARTETGYLLQLEEAGLRFDLTKVFDLIPRTRLAAVWANPQGGGLELRLGCACHARADMLPGGALVIDILDGPPSQGEPEFLADGQPAPPLPAFDSTLTRPRARPIRSLPPLSRQALPTLPADLPLVPDTFAEPDLSPLRDTLLRQMSDGAARGVIGFADPPSDRPEAATVQGARQIRIGQDLGMIAGPPDSPSAPMTTTGLVCPPAAAFDIAAWGPVEGGVVENMAIMHQNLLGEFDRPDTDAVLRAVRFQLYLGFGAEARQTLSFLSPEPEEAALLRALSWLVDGHGDPEGRLAALGGCDNPAALWSAVAQSQGEPRAPLNAAAVTLAFSALPPGLRHHLGPGLVTLFAGSGDPATAENLKRAILRAPIPPGPEVRLMQIDGSTDQDHAASELSELARQSGPAAVEATLRLLDHQVAQGLPVPPETATTLAALAREHRDTDMEPRLMQARALALAGAGDFDGAFAALPQAPGAEAGVWAMLATQAADQALITHAIPASLTARTSVTPATRRQISRRLLDLGFADAALAWGADLTPGEEADRLLVAEAELMRGDAQAGLRAIAGLQGAEANRLRAALAERLNDPATAVLYRALGEADRATRAQARIGDWAGLAAGEQGSWQTAARLAVADPGTDSAEATPLARAKALISESAAARDTLSNLLTAAKATEPEATPTPSADEN
jgi:hypothetical protein